jgi:nucleoside-diphosphate-sugar epimerase
MDILTTGTSSGLGKYIHENFGGIGLTRSTSPERFTQLKSKGVDVIIHCAFNRSRKVNSDSLSQYLQDNVLLTNELVSLPHKKFIFLSSVDVYPKDGKLHVEDELIDVNAVEGIYALTKLISESLVQNNCKNYLILRGAAFLGKYARQNSLMKIAEKAECKLSLSGSSRFNYVLYSDILGFLKLALKRELGGIYNLASGDNITLREAADLLKRKVKFGTYSYDVGNIDNSKISSVFSAFGKTSREVITQFVKEK